MLMRPSTTGGWLRTLLFVVPLIAIVLSACVAPAGTAPAAAPAEATAAPAAEAPAADAADPMMTIYGTKLPDDALPYEQQIAYVAVSYTHLDVYKRQVYSLLEM